MHRLLSDLAAEGVAVLMISSELPEVLGMADRIVVLFEGRVSRRARPRRGERGRDHAGRDRARRGGGRVTRDAEAPYRRRARRRRARTSLAELLVRFRELGIVLALVLVVGATAIDNRRFVSATSLQQLLSGAAIIALLAIGETMVIVTRNVDLSVGSVLGLSAYAVGDALRAPPARLDRRSCCSPALGIGARLRHRQRRDRDHRARAEPRRHARDAVRDPRHRRDLGRRQPGRRLLRCPNSFNKIGYGKFLGVPYLGLIAIVAVAVATYCDAQLPDGPRPLRDRLEPGGGAAGGHPGRRRASSSPSSSAAAIAGVAGVFWLSKFGSVDAIAGRRLRVPGDRRRGRRRRRDLRRERHGARRRARRAAAEHDQQRARGRQRLVVLELGARRARCCSPRSRSTGWSSIRVAPALSTRRSRRG